MVQLPLRSRIVEPKRTSALLSLPWPAGTYAPWPVNGRERKARYSIGARTRWSPWRRRLRRQLPWRPCTSHHDGALPPGGGSTAERSRGSRPSRASLLTHLGMVCTPDRRRPICAGCWARDRPRLRWSRLVVQLVTCVGLGSGCRQVAGAFQHLDPICLSGARPLRVERGRYKLLYRSIAPGRRAVPILAPAHAGRRSWISGCTTAARRTRCPISTRDCLWRCAALRPPLSA
jgi:hypothetical protein